MRMNQKSASPTPSADTPHSVGQAVLRREDIPLLRGAGQFVDDLTRDGLLYARFVRSTIAHGQIIHINIEAASRLDGVVAVLTGVDLALADLVPPMDSPDVTEIPRPMLAIDVVRFAGEAVAVVLAQDPYVAEDAAELVEIQIEPWVVVTDPVAATASGAPDLHPHISNVLFEKQAEFGNVDDGFAAAAARVELTLTSPGKPPCRWSPGASWPSRQGRGFGCMHRHRCRTSSAEHCASCLTSSRTTRR